MMHAPFLLVSLFLTAAIGSLDALLLHLTPPGERKSLALAVLAVPVFALTVPSVYMLPRFWDGAQLTSGGWLPSLGLLLAIAAAGSGVVALNLARLVLAERLLKNGTSLLDGAMSSRTVDLARKLGTPCPDIRVLTMDAPLAATGGLRRTTIVLSRWLIENLDARELDAALAHELAHLVRRDPLVRLLTRLLRDPLIYLPAGWYAHIARRAEQELGADALAVEVTQRPLALASARGKVWRQAATAPSPVTLAGMPNFDTSPASRTN